MSYKSPIETITEEVSRSFDNAVVSAVVKVGINVNRDELIRALKYDRDQYDAGYHDGVMEGRTRDDAMVPYSESDGYADGAEVWDKYCPVCNYAFEDTEPNYCPECGQKIKWRLGL